MTAGTTRDSATVGPYRLVRKLGEGGMGVVHLALDPAGRPVALKVLRAHVANDPDARHRLAREVATLRRVRHPRVAEVLDADVAGDEPYLVTRFVPGRSLEDEVRAVGRLPAGQVARMGRELMGALSSIHAAGVVHRDLKPANVMLVDGDPVLIDFGIAHVIDESRITRTGLVMGTPGYLSPELIYGDPVTPATDWWAWGATLAFAATGRQPFGTGPIEVILERVRRGTIDLDGVDPLLGALLRRTLTVDPAGRPTAAELQAGLAAVIAGVTTAPSSQSAAGITEPASQDRTVRTSPPDRTVRTPPPPVSAPPPMPSYPAPSHPAPSHPAPSHPAQPRPVSSYPPPVPYPYAQPQQPPYPQHAQYPQHTQYPQYGQYPQHGQAYPAGAVQPSGHAPAQQPWTSPYPGPGAPPPTRPYPDPSRGGLDHYRPPDPRAPAGGQESTPPRRVTGTVLAGMIALGLVAAVAPGGALVIALLAGVLARTVQRSGTGLQRRRQELGRSRTDVAVTVAALPWRLLMAVLVTVVAAILPALVMASTAFIAGSVGSLDGTPHPSRPVPLLLGMAAGIATAWWGPGGWSLRTGIRAVVRPLTAAPGARLAALSFFVLVAAAVVMLVLTTPGYVPDWTPFTPPAALT